MAWWWTQPVDAGNAGVRGIQRRYQVIAPPDWLSRRLLEPWRPPLPVVVVLHDGGNPWCGPGTGAAFAGLPGPRPVAGAGRSARGSELYPCSPTLLAGTAGTGEVPHDELFVAIYPEAQTYRPMTVMAEGPDGMVASEIQDGSWNEHSSLNAPLLQLDDTAFVEAAIDEVLWRFQARLATATGHSVPTRGPPGDVLRHVEDQNRVLDDRSFRIAGYGSGGNLAFKVLATAQYHGFVAIAVVNGTLGGFRQKRLVDRQPPELYHTARPGDPPPHTVWIQNWQDSWWPLARENPHRAGIVMRDGLAYVFGAAERETMRRLGAAGGTDDYHPLHLGMDSALDLYLDSMGFVRQFPIEHRFGLKADAGMSELTLPDATFQLRRATHAFGGGTRRMYAFFDVSETLVPGTGHAWVRIGEEALDRPYTRMIWEFFKNPDVFA